MTTARATTPVHYLPTNMVGEVGFRDAVGRGVYVDAQELDEELLAVLGEPELLAQCNDRWWLRAV
ncbi:hypothetical protein [Corynebacterium phoceense]|uniref:hypothetical protein n=1 Tax=Corynebacterium phoceense TaxID=1686286 RepID=UPI001D408C4B|nr:hypothetical protein [Corynebacterium phoceense]HJG43780.1 hypothetical protein [Corynebacterium phoceense]